MDDFLPVFLPETQLFRPLIANPRWPRFSASYQRYTKGDLLKNVGSVSFGESFSIYRFRGPFETTMEVGINPAIREYRIKIETVPAYTGTKNLGTHQFGISLPSKPTCHHFLRRHYSLPFRARAKL
ncbi:MAG: DUF1207 domain-containing protein [Deltaproteobacteria bacterium]|nr:DUF1207 domain-containing protein [Deltaproteobacteria bacterium]